MPAGMRQNLRKADQLLVNFLDALGKHTAGKYSWSAVWFQLQDNGSTTGWTWARQEPCIGANIYVLGVNIVVIIWGLMCRTTDEPKPKGEPTPARTYCACLQGLVWFQLLVRTLPAPDAAVLQPNTELSSLTKHFELWDATGLRQKHQLVHPLGVPTSYSPLSDGLRLRMVKTTYGNLWLKPSTILTFIVTTCMIVFLSSLRPAVGRCLDEVRPQKHLQAGVCPKMKL